MTSGEGRVTEGLDLRSMNGIEKITFRSLDRPSLCVLVCGSLLHSARAYDRISSTCHISTSFILLGLWVGLDHFAVFVAQQ